MDKQKLLEYCDNFENFKKEISVPYLPIHKQIEIAEEIKKYIFNFLDIYPDDFFELYKHYYIIKYLTIIAKYLDVPDLISKELKDNEEFYDRLESSGFIYYFNTQILNKNNLLEIIDNYCEIFNIQVANSLYAGLNELAMELQNAANTDIQSIQEALKNYQFE